jgi:hypothetical protein
VGEVSGNTRCVHDIVEGKFIDERAELEEEGQRLKDKEALVSQCSSA